jgi:hypothetical protein
MVANLIECIRCGSHRANGDCDKQCGDSSHGDFSTGIETDCLRFRRTAGIFGSEFAGATRARWFQFSLKTLLIGVALLAVACCVVVDRGRLVRERDEALQREAAALKRESTTQRELRSMENLAEDMKRSNQTIWAELKQLRNAQLTDAAAQP